MISKKLLSIFLAIFFVNLTHQFEHRIIDGIETDIKFFPYQVSIFNGKYHECGGVLISKQWVLTAAHCLKKFYLVQQNYQVRIGSSDSASGGILVDVLGDLVHPNYIRFANRDYDVGLILLANYDKDPNEIATAPWPGCEQRKCQSGDMLEVVGWGFNFITDPERKTKLQLARVPIISNKECSTRWNGNFNPKPRNFCAGDPNNRIDSAQGDSGGAATCRNDLIGLVSAGTTYFEDENKNLFQYPGIYTDLTNVVIQEWIEVVTGIKRPCEGQNDENIYYYDPDRNKP